MFTKYILLLFGGCFVCPPRFPRSVFNVGVFGGFVYPPCSVRFAFGVGVCGGFVYRPCLPLVVVRVCVGFCVLRARWFRLSAVFGAGSGPSRWFWRSCVCGGFVLLGASCWSTQAKN